MGGKVRRLRLTACPLSSPLAGGTLASHSRRYLDAGFRVIVPDLPSHGYSTGVHVYQPNIRGYTSGLHAVLHDVNDRDDKLYRSGEALLKSQRRDCFLLGLSFGGLVALSYALHYPASLRSDETEEWEIPVDGIIAVGPMIGYSVQNCSITPTMEKLISMANHYLHLSRLELVVPHKKCLDKDPKVYKTLVTEDKRSHQGAFRIGHLAALHYGMIELRQRAKEIVHPIFVQQGGQDRVVDFTNCVDFVRNISSADKRCVVYPVCQHVIYRKAKTDEEDQAGRVACIEDNVEWMCERSRVPTMHRQLSAISMQSDCTMYDEGVPIHPLALGEDVGSQRTALSAALLTPVQPSTPDFSSSNAAFFDPSKPIPTYSESESGESDDSDEENKDHPLIANSHWTTLPTLNKIAPERAYRTKWSLHEQLRPFDIVCEHKK